MLVEGQLIGTGIAMGIAHVLTGPDHLSALATLSANVGGNCKAFGLGARWGVGHSTGLVVVAAILIALSNAQGDEMVDMSETTSSILESFVGVFMLLLGGHGLLRAFRRRRRRRVKLGRIMGGKDNEGGKNDDEDTEGSLLLTSAGESSDSEDEEEQGIRGGEYGGMIDYAANMNYMPTTKSEDPVEQGANWQSGGEVSPSLADADISMAAPEDSISHHHLHLESGLPPRQRRHCCRWCRQCRDSTLAGSCSSKILAFGIGIVHGISGPGGVLGVIPAVNLRNTGLAVIYLCSFCLTSIVVMGLFAVAYGMCSKKLAHASRGVWAGAVAEGQWEFRVECFSAGLSVTVGAMWLALLSAGKLHDVFP